MSGLKYALAMVAAGGATVIAADADASTIVDFGYSPADSSNVSLIDGVTSFTYGPGPFGVKLVGNSDVPGNPPTDAPSSLGLYTTTPGLPSAGETFTSKKVFTVNDNAVIDPSTGQPVTDPSTGQTVKVAVPVYNVESYIHLMFNVEGQEYVGTATIGADQTLESIEYIDAPAAVPEPETWALLIGGLGLTGAALRGRRRQAALSA